MNKNTKKLFNKCILVCTLICFTPSIVFSQETNTSKIGAMVQQDDNVVNCFIEYGKQICTIFAQLDAINKDFLDKDNTQTLQEFCNLFDACNSELNAIVDEMEIALQKYKSHNLYPTFKKFVQELKARQIEGIKITNVLRSFINSKGSVLGKLLKMKRELNKTVYGTTSKRVIDQKKAQSKAQFKQLCSEIQTFNVELAHALKTIVDNIEKTATTFKEQPIGHTKQWGNNRLK